MRYIATTILVFLFAQQLFAEQIRNVYWYNLPKDSLIINGQKIQLKSYLELEMEYTFTSTIIVEALDQHGIIKFSCTINNEELQNAQRNNSLSNKTYSFFKDVLYLDSVPYQINIKDANGVLLKKIVCQYFTLSGKLSSSLAYSYLYIGLIPNNFGDPQLTLKVDEQGRYEISLPKRNYMNIYALSDTYGKSTLENWFYNLIGDSDVNLNFEITNAEVYNLHVWRNKGGGKSLFIIFRPMSLKYNCNEIMIGKKLFKEIKSELPLDNNNVKVSIGNIELNIISIQDFHETGYKDFAIKSHIIQVDYNDINISNKTLKVEFDSNGFRGIGRIQLND